MMEVIYDVFGDGSPSTGVLDKPTSQELLAVLPAFFFGSGFCFLFGAIVNTAGRSNPWSNRQRVKPLVK